MTLELEGVLVFSHGFVKCLCQLIVGIKGEEEVGLDFKKCFEYLTLRSDISASDFSLLLE